MYILEIFPNNSLLKITFDESKTLQLPNDLEDVLVFDEKKKPIKFQFIDNKLSLGEIVTVDGVSGILESMGDSITISTDNSLVKFIKPKMITAKNSSKNVSLEKHNTIVGSIPNLYWNPIYVIILSNNPDKINNISLIGLINATQIASFDVDKIIFDTKPVLAKSYKYASRTESQSLQFASAVPIDIVNETLSTKYNWDTKTNIKGEISIPLLEYLDIDIKRIYFLSLNDGEDINYGYMFDMPNYIPHGKVKIFSENLDLLGITNMKIYGKRVILEISKEEKLFVQTIYDESVANNGEIAIKSLNFKIKITSKFNMPVVLVVRYNTYEKLLSAKYKVYENFPGEMIWLHDVKPGDTTIEEALNFQTKPTKNL